MRDHGGDLDRARAAFGGTDWVDLSTGINPVPYPVPDVARRAYTALPTHADIAALEHVAAQCYGAQVPVAALGGAQAAIQIVPQLRRVGAAAVLAPTYNEHAAALRDHGWAVREVDDLPALTGAEIAVIVNPNNPDGRSWPPDALAELSAQVGLLVVDESFADPHPELSMVPRLRQCGDRALVLRSFGKFYGLAGLRLGFAIGGEATIAKLRALAGPWAVNGPAIAIAGDALANTGWRKETAKRLSRDAARLDALAACAGWQLVGGTALFRTYAMEDATAAQTNLARARIWTRVFPYSKHWLRMGLPGPENAWGRVERALSSRRVAPTL
ncbi:MAG: threonine-phosphate decarboxylase CobD [Pseudomonadota bacterium]